MVVWLAHPMQVVLLGMHQPGHMAEEQPVVDHMVAVVQMVAAVVRMAAADRAVEVVATQVVAADAGINQDRDCGPMTIGYAIHSST
jgi:hypothetical protein